MKELILEIGKARVFKDSHINTVKIGRNNKGYFIIANSTTEGPFERIFIDKSQKHQLNIVGYAGSKKIFYRISNKGISLLNKEDNELDYFSSSDSNIDDYTLLAKVKGHNIYLDNNEDAFFAVNINEDIKPFEKHEKFDSYQSLIKFYKNNKNINLYDNDLAHIVNNLSKILINFENLFSIVTTLTVDTLPEESLFDAVMGFNSEKRIFEHQTDKFIVSTYSNKKANQLIQSGYELSPSYVFEHVCKNFPLEMDKYGVLVESKLSELSKDCLIYLQNNSNLNPRTLKQHMSSMTIDDLPKNIADEIKLKSYSTKKTFLTMLKICLEKEDKLFYIKQGYKNYKMFAAIFPELYEELYEIAKDRLNELYSQQKQKK